MAGIKVTFLYITGIKREIFTEVTLSGSWDLKGKFSNQWTICPMEKIIYSDGCPAYRAEVILDISQVGWQFKWGVYIDSPEHKHIWGIPTEVKAEENIKRYCFFTLGEENRTEHFYLTYCRLLGANKHYPTTTSPAGIRFALWAPNATAVELVFAAPGNNYIADDGAGAWAEPGIPLLPTTEGVWVVDQNSYPPFADFQAFNDKAYMYKVTRSDGSIRYRTDIYSRRQAGKGNQDPEGRAYNGPPEELDGSVSCSVVVDPEELPPPQPPAADSPCDIRDLIIYELHIGALGYAHNRPGNLEDALELIPHLQELGVNAVELLPLSDLSGDKSWGHTTSHYLAIEESAGGKDGLKRFVDQCHAAGILVIMDVVYNHYTHKALRSFWKYDSPKDEDNIYYWYEGKADDYPFDEEIEGYPGGYIDNGSSGFAPRYHEDMVRKLFTSSAVTLLEEFNLDGLRFDLVSAIHNNNRLNCNKNMNINQVNIFGAKFLREINRTLRLIRKDVLLIAEDHSLWDRITSPLDFNSESDDSLGFDALWFMEFYHNLIGDTTANRFSYARLIFEAGFGENWPLKMDLFAYQGLNLSRFNKIVFHESHDEAGNNEEITSLRTIEVASHYRMESESITFAESRCRFAAGMSLLSAGIPMFFMFEELRARNKYDHANFLANREDYKALKSNEGKRLFHFYTRLITFRKEHSAIRSPNIKILHIHNNNRVLVFRRWDETESLIIVASLNNLPFDQGYDISHYAITGNYREIFNSDLQEFGGQNRGNGEHLLNGEDNSLTLVIPANGFIILSQQE